MSSGETSTSSKDGWSDIGNLFFHALLIAFLVRIFFYQPFNIPSGSMQSTLLVGDYLFVSKLSYGYSRYSFPFGLNLFNGRVFASQPKRGDVVVFKTPADNSTDYIKRVIGLPGDRIEVRKGIVWLNGKEIPRRRVSDFVLEEFGQVRRIPRYEETLPDGRVFTVLDERNSDADDYGPVVVPASHYFMMGDNRDNSADSRMRAVKGGGVGFVHFDNFVGRADFLFLSIATNESVPAIFTDSPMLTRAAMLVQIATFGRGDIIWHFMRPGSEVEALGPWSWPTVIRWNRIFSLIK